MPRATDQELRRYAKRPGYLPYEEDIKTRFSSCSPTCNEVRAALDDWSTQASHHNLNQNVTNDFKLLNNAVPCNDEKPVQRNASYKHITHIIFYDPLFENLFLDLPNYVASCINGQYENYLDLEQSTHVIGRPAFFNAAILAIRSFKQQSFEPVIAFIPVENSKHTILKEAHNHFLKCRTDNVSTIAQEGITIKQLGEFIGKFYSSSRKADALEDLVPTVRATMYRLHHANNGSDYLLQKFDTVYFAKKHVCCNTQAVKDAVKPFLEKYGEPKPSESVSPNDINKNKRPPATDTITTIGLVFAMVLAVAMAAIVGYVNETHSNIPAKVICLYVSDFNIDAENGIFACYNRNDNSASIITINNGNYIIKADCPKRSPMYLEGIKRGKYIDNCVVHVYSLNDIKLNRLNPIDLPSELPSPKAARSFR